VLGPAGAWWLRDRVEGVIPTHTSHAVRTARKLRGGVRLELDGPSVDRLDVDHVIVATGFRVDVNRLEFLNKDLRLRLDTEAGYPVLDRTGESSADGLFFSGAPAAVSLGPSMRFIAGTHNQTRRLARQVARQVTSTPRTAGRVRRQLHPEMS
jgi:NADPH-dependent 2,4-dienoyl-CoA reductase/sulfur reductase-like enzyme